MRESTRESTRIVGLFGALGLGTFAVLLLAAMAGADTVQVYQSTAPRREVITISPGSASLSDPYARESALRATVSSNLAASRSLAGSNIVVTSSSGTIVLAGTVAEADDIARAELIARQTPGVRAVVSQLAVDPAMVAAAETADRIDDAELARRVSERLAAEFPGADVDRKWEYGYEIESDELELDVAADDGEVVIGGEVPSYDALGRAVAVARSVPGVAAVRTSLNIDADRDTASTWESYPGPFEKPQHHPFFGPSRDYDD
jgi:osmotically-inducible protein OsmY